MDRIITAKKRVWALVALTLSTLSSYAKIVGVVVCEQLWRIPRRQLRTATNLDNARSRRMS
jgi:hypothetical protein